MGELVGRPLETPYVITLTAVDPQVYAQPTATLASAYATILLKRVRSIC